jgi:N-ethylmaleimide reductase
VANPDFPHRLAEGLPLAAFDSSTLFGGDERGYTDYPVMPQAETSVEASDIADVC